MNTSNIVRKTILPFLISMIVAVPVAAQGIIIGPDARPVSLELRKHHVEADVQERLAVVTVEHEFYNAGTATVEGTFLFPLPPEAQVSRFSMTVDGQEMPGELLSADEARTIYEDIVRRSLDPALLEMADYRTFRARLFPVPPGATRTLTLRYDATLPADGPTVTFRYPMQGTLADRPVGWRPPHPRPETPRPEHDAPGAGQHLIRVHLTSATGLHNVYSPSHDVDVRRAGNRRAEAVFERRGALDGRDFVLYYSLDASDIGATLLAHRPYTDRPGYFMLLIDPPAELDERRIQPQDVVLVLDTSGSMRGDKIDQARDALRYCLTHLGPRDRFGLVAFSTDVDAFRDDLRPASARDDALYFVDQLEARGGTNINDALLAAVRMLDDSERGMIVFLTDGLPSVGVTDEAAIRHNVQQAAGDRLRLFPFGVGYDVNTRLLDGLARSVDAFADYISPDEPIDARIASFFDKVRHPVLTDLNLTIDGADAYALAPGTLPDLYKGTGLIVAGRYRQPGEATVTLRGRMEDRTETKRYRFRFPEAARERDFVARLWATRRVGHLLEAIRLQGENEALKEEIIALAKEFGLVTPYTSYLVTEDEEWAANPPPGIRLREGEAHAAPTPAAMDAVSGEAAVTASKQIRALQEADAVPTTPRGYVTVEGRTLRYTADGAWVDTAFDPDTDEAVSLAFTSDAYFAFLRRYPDARAFAHLGPQVTFFFRDRYVQVGTDGAETWSEAEMQRLFG